MDLIVFSFRTLQQISEAIPIESLSSTRRAFIVLDKDGTSNTQM